LNLRKIIKIVTTRLRLRCTKFDFGCGSAPDPAGSGLQRSPDSLGKFKGKFKGPTSKGKREGEGKGGKRGREEKGRGGD